jgi:polysaccharide pyruvyl transferase WcaK-like protein
MLAGIRASFPDEHELRIVAPQSIEGLTTYPQQPIDMFRAGMEVDWIWMGGGSSIHDEKSNPKFKHRGLIHAVFIFLVATVTRCRLAYIGMGLGPLRHPWKRRIVGALFRRANYVSLRDSASMEEWRRCAPAHEHFPQRTFDSCVALASPSLSTSTPPCEANQQRTTPPEVIGLNLLPYFRIYEDDPTGDERLLDLLVESLQKALAPSTRVRIFTFNKKETESEEAFIEYARQELSRSVETEVVSYSSPRHTIEEIGQCDAMIAMRYHGSMMAYLAGVPQIVLGYHEKCTSLARDIGCSPGSIIDIRHLHTRKPLIEAVKGLQKRTDAYCATLPISEAQQQFESSYFPEAFRT